MTREVVFNLISKNKENLIKMAKAVRVDFEAILGYYIVFEKMPSNKALLKISDDIVEEYKDKMDIWDNIQKELIY